MIQSLRPAIADFMNRIFFPHKQKQISREIFVWQKMVFWISISKKLFSPFTDDDADKALSSILSEYRPTFKIRYLRATTVRWWKEEKQKVTSARALLPSRQKSGQEQQLRWLFPRGSVWHYQLHFHHRSAQEAAPSFYCSVLFSVMPSGMVTAI